MNTVPQFEHWIDGHPVPPVSGRHLDSTSPYDGELVSRIADGSAEDVERAVTAAHRAQPAWGRTTTTERFRVLTSIAAGIRANIDRLVELECAEGGKLPVPARVELLIAADYFEYYGSIVRTLANATEYGLAGAVWCGDAARGMAVAHRIEAGQVAVNGGVMGVETPFGGYRTSGIGREKGIAALYEYTQLKTVSVTLPDHGTN